MPPKSLITEVLHRQRCFLVGKITVWVVVLQRRLNGAGWFCRFSARFIAAGRAAGQIGPARPYFAKRCHQARSAAMPLQNDNHDDATPNSTPSLAAVLGPGLLLPKIALQQLFALPGDALPQGITRLTGLTQDDVRRFAAFDAAAQYDQALRHEAALFYAYALTGWLAYQHVLGDAIRAQLYGSGTGTTADTVMAAELVAEGIVGLLEGCVPTPTRTTVEALNALFAQEKYSPAPHLPALAPHLPPAEAAPEDDEVWLTMQPNPAEMNLFGMALNLTTAAAYGVPHPLGRALAEVAALGTPAEATALARRFRAAPTGEAPELALTGPDVVRLYLSLQVLALLCVADLQPELMQRLDPELDHAGPWTDPDHQQAFVAWVCTQTEAFGMLFDDLFGEEPAYLAAKATARALAELV